MLYSLKGIVTNLKPWEMILEVGGIGYQVKITLDAYEKLKEKIEGHGQAETFFHTRVIYRENERIIYGFITEQEAQLFDFMHSLQGIGPQLACNLISTLGAKNLLEAIETGNVKSLIKVPKIGKNIAEKIIFESAQRKKKLLNIKSYPGVLGVETQNELKSQLWEQLEEALLQFGFQKKELLKAKEKIDQANIEKPPEETSHIQEWIRLYLGYL